MTRPRRLLSIALLALCAACQQDDPWEVVDEVCQWEVFLEENPPKDEGLGNHITPKDGYATFPSVACIEVLADQVGADLDDFEANPLGGVRLTREDLLDGANSDEEAEAPLFQLMSALRVPFAFDMGRVPDMEPSELLSSDLVERIEKEASRRGTNDVGRTLFSYVSRHIRKMRPATSKEKEKEKANTLMHRKSRGLVLVVRGAKGLTGIRAFGLVLHEARHHDPPWHHTRVFPEGREASMDDDVHAAYGAELAVPVLVFRSIPFEDMAPFDQYWTRKQLSPVLVDSMGNIESLLAPDGTIRNDLYMDPDGPNYVVDPWK